MGFGYVYLGEIIQWLIGAQPKKLTKDTKKNKKFIKYKESKPLVAYSMPYKGTLKYTFVHMENCIDQCNTTSHFPTPTKVYDEVAMYRRQIQAHELHFRALLPSTCYIFGHFSYLERIYIPPLFQVVFSMEFFLKGINL